MILAGAGIGWCGVATAAEGRLASAAPDSSVTVLPDLVVDAEAPGTAVPTAVRIGESLIERRDPVSVAELGPLLPATRVLVNSRGEALFMVRGAPERHVRLWLNGIPLAVPWDERADLALVPALAIARIDAQRGAPGALAGVGCLAGNVRLTTEDRAALVPATRVESEGGEVGVWRIAGSHERRIGRWRLTAAAAHRQRDAQTLPHDFVAPSNQSGATRTNSDLRQNALLVAGRRALADNGEMSLTMLVTDGEKGVPPETHIADARFWRYPLQRRLLVGGSVDKPLDARRDWRLLAAVSADFFAQDIHPYADASYSGPPLVAGDDYERDRDATLYARGRLERWLGTRTIVSLQTEARYTRHRETLVEAGPELAYSQWLGGVTAEMSLQPAPRWRVITGGGWEAAATPETGDKPDRGVSHAAVAAARLERELGTLATVHTAYARRSRFPSLRELYSGALGRFVLNPDLAPERSDQFEVGLDGGGRGWSLGASAFANTLTGGIERVAVPGTESRFQRVNQTRIRTLGVEVVASWRPRPELALSGHHTILDAKARAEGGEDRPAEDRPQYLTTLAVRWQPIGGWDLGVEGHVLGPRHSADPTADSGLRRLPAQARWDLRLAWTGERVLPGTTTLEAFVRLENVADSLLESQTGLPEPGRTWRGGLKLRLGEG